MTGYLRITSDGALRVIAFDNPRKKNAINRSAYNDLMTAILDATTDDAVKVVALTGVGDFFSSGNDISDAVNVVDYVEYVDSLMDFWRKFVQAFIRFPKLLVAVVNGPCIGIAATLTALCDVVYASDNAYFLTPFTALGLCAEACSSYTFPRILGPSKAAEMLLCNHRMNAAEALRFGFVSEVFSVDELTARVWPKVRQMTELTYGSVVATKRLLKQQNESALLAALEQEIVVQKKCLLSDTARAARIKFLNRKSKL